MQFIMSLFLHVNSVKRDFSYYLNSSNFKYHLQSVHLTCYNQGMSLTKFYLPQLLKVFKLSSF